MNAPSYSYPSKAVVTGGAGFIGSELVRQLCEQGCEVVVVDTLVNGKLENLPSEYRERWRLEKADIRDENRLRPLLHSSCVVYHLACMGVRHSLHSPLENHAVNASGSLTLVKLAHEQQVKRFVHVSSSEVYGTALTAPMSETHPTFPTTVYGSSKLCGEAYARAFFSTYEFPTVVVRPFNTYGPRCHHEGDSGEVIPKFLLRCTAGQPLIIFGDGLQTRDFSYVSDTAAGILKAGLSEKAIGQTINLGSAEETSILALSEAVARSLGAEQVSIRHEAARPGDVRRHLCDSSKAHMLLGHTAKINLAEGLQRLKNWYDETGYSAQELLASEEIFNWERSKPRDPAR